jgi:hypothetical protein
LIQNRIIGSGIEKLDNILFNPRNWRIHPLNQQNALNGVLDEVGWVQEVIINQRTGNLVDGHLRCQLASRKGEIEIPVKYVDLSEEEEALVLATIDPIGAMAATDKEKLDELFTSIQSDNAEVNKMLEEIAEKEGLDYKDDNNYSRKIESPCYEPKGEKPNLADLYDTSETDKLISDIELSDLPEDEKKFLRIAAQRHTVLRFDRIADYYAHSGKDIQSLMEDNALVIIDFNKAIELGFVELTENIAKMVAEEYPDDE